MTIPGSLLDAIGSASANVAASQPTVTPLPPAQAERRMSDADIQTKLEATAQTLLDRGVKPEDITPVIQRQHAFLTGALGQAVQKANNAGDIQAVEAGQGVGPAQATAQDVGGGLQHVSQALTLGAAKYPFALLRAGAEGVSPKTALGEENQDLSQFTADHPVASPALEIAGGSLNPVNFTGARLHNAGLLGKIGLGAVEGAAQGGVRAGVESGGDLDAIKQGAEGGALAGGVVTPLASGVAKGVANLGLRTGLTDALSSGLNKVAPTLNKIPGLAPLGETAGNLAAATGTRGQVNEAMTGRQHLLTAVGQDASGQTPAALQLAKDAEIKAKANDLYNTARADTKVVDDARVRTLLQDPEVQSVFQSVKALRDASGNPLPEVTNVSAPPQQMVDKGIQQSDWQRLMGGGASSESSPFFNAEDAAKRAAFNQKNIAQLPTGLSGLGTEAMPDPEALAKMKQYLSAASKGLDSPLQMKQDQATATLAKVTQLRNILHEVSPAWKQADAYYADAMGQREAYIDGYNAFRGAKNIEGSNVPEKSAEAMEQTITTPRRANEPPEAQANRLEAFKNGVKARQVDQVRGAPVDRGNASAVGVPSLAPDAVTMGVRNLGNLNDVPAQSALENTLATARGQAAKQPLSAQNRLPTSKIGFLRAGLRKIISAPDLLTTVPGEQMIAARTLSPALNLREIGRSSAGQTLLDALHEAAQQAGRKGLPAAYVSQQQAQPQP